MAEKLTVSHIQLERVVDCPFSEIQDYVTDFLGEHRFGKTPNRFAARSDLTELGKPHDELFIHWQAVAWLVPEFDVVLRFRILRLRTRVLLHGDYRAPLDGDGSLIDRAFGRHLMRAILAGLLARIAGYAERKERQYRCDHPPVLVGRGGRPVAFPAHEPKSRGAFAEPLQTLSTPGRMTGPQAAKQL